MTDDQCTPLVTPRVAFVEQESQLGGVEVSTLLLARFLDRERYQPVVIAPEPGPLTQRCAAAGIPVLYSPRPRFRSTSWRWRGHTYADPLAILVNPARLWQASRHMVRQLSACQADLAVTKGLLAHFYGGWAAHQLGIPCVWHVQDEVPARRAGGLYLHFLRWAAGKLASALVGDAATIAEQFKDHPRVSMIYNGIDLKEFHPAAPPGSLRGELGIPPGALLVGNVARLTDWKGQHVLIQAIHNLAEETPQVHLVLIGSALFDDDGYERTLRRLAKEGPAAGRIHFAGYRTDLADCLADLTVYVHPSVRKDTAPLALLSALAAGLPIIISAVPGMIEVVEPGVSALTFAPGDANALTVQLRTLLQRPSLRTRLAKAARELATHRFSVQAHVQAMTAIFDQVLLERSPPR